VVFMTAQPTGTPPALAHNVRYNNVLHKRVVVLPVATARVPPVPDEERLSIQPLGHHIFNVRVQYGFMEEPNVLDARSKRASKGLRLTLTMSRTSSGAKPSS